MKRIALLAAGATLAAIPAVVGLSGNQAFSHEVPVRIPSGVQPVPAADVQPSDRPSARPSPEGTPGRNRGPAVPADAASPGDDDHGGNSGPGGGDDDGSGGRGGSGRR